MFDQTVDTTCEAEESPIMEIAAGLLADYDFASMKERMVSPDNANREALQFWAIDTLADLLGIFEGEMEDQEVAELFMAALDNQFISGSNMNLAAYEAASNLWLIARGGLEGLRDRSFFNYLQSLEEEADWAENDDGKWDQDDEKANAAYIRAYILTMTAINKAFVARYAFQGQMHPQVERHALVPAVYRAFGLSGNGDPDRDSAGIFAVNSSALPGLLDGTAYALSAEDDLAEELAGVREMLSGRNGLGPLFLFPTDYTKKIDDPDVIGTIVDLASDFARFSEELQSRLPQVEVALEEAPEPPTDPAQIATRLALLEHDPTDGVNAMVLRARVSAAKLEIVDDIVRKCSAKLTHNKTWKQTNLAAYLNTIVDTALSRIRAIQKAEGEKGRHGNVDLTIKTDHGRSVEERTVNPRDAVGYYNFGRSSYMNDEDDGERLRVIEKRLAQATTEEGSNNQTILDHIAALEAIKQMLPASSRVVGGEQKDALMRDILAKVATLKA